MTVKLVYSQTNQTIIHALYIRKVKQSKTLKKVVIALSGIVFIFWSNLEHNALSMFVIQK